MCACVFTCLRLWLSVCVLDTYPQKHTYVAESQHLCMWPEGNTWENFIKGGPEPLEKEIYEILGSKREDRSCNPFFELVQKTCQLHFSYLLRHGKFCKAPRDMRKFPQKCQKIAGCWGRTVYVRNLRSPRNLAHPLRNDPVQTISRVNHGLTQRASVTSLLVLCLVFFNKNSVKSGFKHFKM